jgi:hypothetical protein
MPTKQKQFTSEAAIAKIATLRAAVPAPKTSGLEPVEIGVVLELKQYSTQRRRNEKAAYAQAANEVAVTLKSVGVRAPLIFDETDPRLKDVNVLVHVAISEDERIQHEMVSDTVSVSIPGPAPGGMKVPIPDTPIKVTVVDRHFLITVHDFRTGLSTTYFEIEKALVSLIPDSFEEGGRK